MVAVWIMNFKSQKLSKLPKFPNYAPMCLEALPIAQQLRFFNFHTAKTIKTMGRLGRMKVKMSPPIFQRLLLEITILFCQMVPKLQICKFE